MREGFIVPNAGINKKVTFDMFENDIGMTEVVN